MSIVQSTSKIAVAALCAFAFMGVISTAQAGRSTGTWKYYSPYYAPAPDYYQGNGGYGGGYYGYRGGRPAYRYGDVPRYRYQPYSEQRGPNDNH